MQRTHQQINFLGSFEKPKLKQISILAADHRRIARRMNRTGLKQYAVVRLALDALERPDTAPPTVQTAADQVTTG